MCYAEDAAAAHAFVTDCTPIGGLIPESYDCGRDDYYNPDPAPGSYLATHWNTGGRRPPPARHGHRGQPRRRGRGHVRPHAAGQSAAASSASSRLRDRLPMSCSTGSPCLKSMNVGMASTPYLAATA
jgi:hypothetical protein